MRIYPRSLLVTPLALLCACASGSAPPQEDVALIETKFGAAEGEAVPPYGGGDLIAATDHIVAVTLPVRLDLGEGIVDGNRITIPIPPQTAPVEIQLRNANGEILAKVRAEASEQERNTREVEPITQETSVEAMLIAALSASSALDDRAPVGTIRQWVTPDLAAALARASADGRNAQEERDALVRALRGAIVVEQEVASETGLPLDERAVVDAERVLVRTFARAMYAADTPAEQEQIRAALARGLIELREEGGLDAAERLEVAHAASFFERARTATSIAATSALQSFVDQTAQMSALREAVALAEAVETLLVDAGADADVISDANALAQALVSSLEQAADQAAVDNAVVAYRTGLLAADTSVFARVLGVTEGTRSAAESARQSARDERAVLVDRLAAQRQELSSLPTAAGLTVAENVAQEYVAMRIRLAQNAVGLGVFGQRGLVGLGLLLAAERLALPVSFDP